MGLLGEAHTLEILTKFRKGHCPEPSKQFLAPGYGIRGVEVTKPRELTSSAAQVQLRTFD
jgi:hypothetical protein